MTEDTQGPPFSSVFAKLGTKQFSTAGDRLSSESPVKTAVTSQAPQTIILDTNSRTV